MAVDHTKFSPTGDTKTESTDKRWWLLDKKDMPASVNSVVSYLEKNQSARKNQIINSARLYGNLSIVGVSALSQSKLSGITAPFNQRVTYNVVQSAIDTATAKIAKNKPKPLFLTSGGDYRLQRKAKKLDKFVDGVFYENKAYELGPQIFRDAAVWGTGVAHVFNHYGRVKWERVLLSELYVDDVEAFYGDPRQLHRVKNVDRQVLIELFPAKKAIIEQANRASYAQIGMNQNIADEIAVRESWHLPSGPDASDGLHAITIDSGELASEEWDKPFFPFATYQWSKRLFGYWGQGAAEQLQNIQLEINKLLWVIQRSMHLAGTFKIAIENASKIVKEHMNNEIGTVITYTDKPPTYLVPPIVPPEIYQHLRTLKDAAFEQLGISQLSAAAKKPAGLDSGKALREFNDIESDRFMIVGQAYENFFLDLAKLSISVAKDISEEDGSYEVKVPGKKFVDTIDWKEVDLTEDEYVMKVYPVSSLPNEPSGRLQTVQEYTQAGFMSPRTGRKLLDFPDLDQIEDLANAQEDYLHETLEKMVENGVYTPPEPYDDLNLAHELALEYYAQGKNGGLEEGKLELIRNFIQKVIQMKTPPMPVLPPGQAPQANPTPTPTSDLIPNVPQGIY